MSAPAYSFGSRRQFGQRRAAKIHVLDVGEIRRWAQRDGFGLSLPVQCAAMQVRYPGLSRRAIEDILTNRSWRDPAYDRETPDAEWGQLPTALVLLMMLRRMDTLV